MLLTPIRPGDIVQIDKRGHRFVAYVAAKEHGQLSIKPIETNVSYRAATSREVIGHWARRGRTAMPGCVGPEPLAAPCPATAPAGHAVA